MEKGERVLTLTAEEAYEHFLRPQNYFTVALPTYFDFGAALGAAESYLREHGPVSNDKLADVAELTGVNFVLPGSKDGKYAWRGFQLVHPVLYVEAVRTLTTPKEWEIIRERVRLYTGRGPVICSSLLPGAETKRSAAAAAILKWWHGMEMASIKMALYYDAMAQTDIQECYDSITFASVKQALDGGRTGGAGERIEKLLTAMTSGDKMGLPQGNALMDFLAEVTLGYIDTVLGNELKKHRPKGEYTILRYKDDYRIFAQDENETRKILRTLSEVLRKFHLKLNPSKTSFTSDILKSARKPDKHYWDVRQGMLKLREDGTPREVGALKRLLAIYEMSLEYPNSGSVQKAMVDLYKRVITPMKHRPRDVYQIISVTAEIVAHNPKVIPVGIAILSKMMSFNPGISRGCLVKKIRKKAKNMPNIDYLEVFLQRLTVKNKPGLEYKSRLCQLVYEPGTRIWNSSWLDAKLEDPKIVNHKMIREMNFVVPPEEVEVFFEYDAAEPDDFEEFVV